MTNFTKNALITVAGLFGMYTLGRIQGAVDSGKSLDEQNVSWSKIDIPVNPFAKKDDALKVRISKK